MASPAGDILRAGGLTRAIDAWRKAGGLASGWRAAEASLRRQFPGYANNVYATVLGYAQDAADAARRLNIAGANYSLPTSAYADPRALLRAAGGGGTSDRQFRVTVFAEILGSDGTLRTTEFTLTLEQQTAYEKAALEGAASAALQNFFTTLQSNYERFLGETVNQIQGVRFDAAYFNYL